MTHRELVWLMRSREFEAGNMVWSEIGLGATNGASDLLKLEYAYSNSNPSIHDNNGNVLTQKITAPKTSSGTLVLTQSYNYDKLNRLSDAAESG